MSKKQLMCDLDGVIRNFNSMLNQFYNATLGVNQVDRWVTPDFEAKDYNLFSGENYDKLTLDYVWKEYPMEIMLYASPYHGYLDFLMGLAEKLQVLPDWEPTIKFVTHQYTKDAELATSLWYQKHHLYEFGDLFFSHGDDKWEHGSLLIDDKKENLYQCFDKGHEWGVCLARPWNEDIFRANEKYRGRILRGNYQRILDNIERVL